jgi:UDP-glucose 4-epimerase
MRVLVTGGLGYVGRAVALELLGAGHQVDVLSRGKSSVTVPAGARLVEGDIRDRPRLAEIALEGRYQGVCHLAALTRGRESIADPLTYYDVNVGGTINLLDALRDAAQPGGGAVRFVFASTSIVYGSQQTGALSEDLPPKPESPYGASKVAAEQLVGSVAATGLITAITLRLFNVAGTVDGYTDTDPTRIIPNVLRAAYGELPHISVNGDGSAVREFTHVRDVAAAFRLALESGHEGYRLYNVGTGKGVSIRDVIAAAELVTNRQILVRHLPPKTEPHTLISDPNRLIQELGWCAVHSGLSEIFQPAAEAGGAA